MRVNPNSEPLNTEPLGATRAPSRTGARETGLGTDQLSFATVKGLNRALEQTPAARADKVAQAESLIADSTYPPPELIQKISALIAPLIDVQSGAD
jgi:hypothetical protein